MSERDEQRAAELIEEAIRLLLDDGELPMKWALALDILCSDDERRIQIVPQAGLVDWDVDGLFDYALRALIGKRVT